MMTHDDLSSFMRNAVNKPGMGGEQRECILVS